jgi:NDP-sugar pyrophosphorylase family protein
MIPSLDLRALIAKHVASRAAATVVVEVERRARPGSPVDPRQPGGVYVFDRRVLEGVAERGYQDIKQGLLEKLHGAGEKVLTYEVQGIAPRVMDSATYASVDNWLITEEIRSPRFLVDYVAVGDGLRHPSAVVHPSARIIGPVVLGPDVVVEANAVLVGPTSVGRGSCISADAVVSRSTLWEGCSVGESANVDSSLLSDGANVKRGDWVFAAACLSDSPVPVSTPANAAEARQRTPAILRLKSPGKALKSVRLPAGFRFGFPAQQSLAINGER